MESSSTTPNPIREKIESILRCSWDFDSAMKAPAQETFKLTIPTGIEPKGEPAIRTDFRLAQSPPSATPTALVDVREAVDMLIVQGDMKIHHQRSPAEPPAHFLEGEDIDEAESDEDQAGVSSPASPRKRARTVITGKVPGLGLADEGFKFTSVLESHVPAGPAKI